MPHDSTSRTPPLSVESMADEEFYYDGPYLVFTTAYHLKRGFCCNSNCRHCPFKQEPQESAQGS